MKKIIIPLDKKKIGKLKIGDEISLNGVVYIARDQAHKRLSGLIKSKKRLPFDLRGQIVYYCGPNPARKNKIIGSCGPTTSSRMDEFSPLLLRQGLKGMIGKGRRSKEVIDAIKKYKAVYFLTYAGCGALLTKYIKKARPIAFKDLGPEAVYKIEVKDFPVIVGIDAKGDNIYSVGR